MRRKPGTVTHKRDHGQNVSAAFLDVWARRWDSIPTTIRLLPRS